MPEVNGSEDILEQAPLLSASRLRYEQYDVPRQRLSIDQICVGRQGQPLTDDLDDNDSLSIYSGIPLGQPPPYQIARQYSKKSDADFIIYDSIRNLQNRSNGPQPIQSHFID